MKQVKENFEVVTPIMKAAYENMGALPKADAFTDAKAKASEGTVSLDGRQVEFVS